MLGLKAMPRFNAAFAGFPYSFLNMVSSNMGTSYAFTPLLRRARARRCGAEGENARGDIVDRLTRWERGDGQSDHYYADPQWLVRGETVHNATDSGRFAREN